MTAACTLQSCSKDDDGPAYTVATTTFEDFSTSMLASDVYGNNLYGKGYYWMDSNTGLTSAPNDGQYYNGGIAVSGYNNMDYSSIEAGDWYKHQMDVYFINKAGYPGNNNSRYCAVSFGYKSAYADGPSMYFSDSDTTTRTIESLYICNTTYGYNNCMVSNPFGTAGAVPMSAANKGYFKVTFTGLTAVGTAKGSVSAYLIDFTTATSKGVYDGWQKVDLSSLGRIHKLAITMESSDTGTYGMNTAAYFAIDDITVRIDKGNTPAPKAPSI